MWIAIASILGAFFGGGGAATVYQARAKTRRMDAGTLAQAAATVQGIYEQLTEELRDEIKRVLEREKECQEEVVALRRQVSEMSGRVEHVTRRLDDLDGV